MTWQQIVILTVMVANLAYAVFRTGRDRSMSSGEAAWAVLLLFGYYVGFAAILHSGGFW